MNEITLNNVMSKTLTSDTKSVETTTKPSYMKRWSLN